MGPTTIGSFLHSTLLKKPSLLLIIEHVPSLNLRARKLMLLLCQTACSPGDKDTWDSAIEGLCKCRISRNGSMSRYTREEVGQICDTIAESLVVRSFVSMMLRCEAYTGESGFEEVLMERAQKEIGASQHKRPNTGLSYSAFFSGYRHAESYSIYYPLTPAWSSFAYGFARKFCNGIGSSGILFPKVQRRKNMSRESCDLLWEAGYRSPRSRYDQTTLDLELFKRQSGIEIGGKCEMRWAWRFNDLQPRCYYCIGGDAYWTSRYMKRVAIVMMEALPQTKARRRGDPSSISEELDDEDWIVIWDYSAFTTNLSELKFFLYWMSRFAEDFMPGGIKVLDYSDGILHIALHDMLDRYNEGVNQNALYTIFRVASVAIIGECDADIPLVQHNSGMLGVPGNIGFSTALHGLHVSVGSKSHTSSCEIGDDAVAIVDEDPDRRFHKHLEIIGDVHRDKTDILPPIEYGTRQLSKFVKRRFIRTSYGLTIDDLYSFPILAPVFGVTDEFHTIREEERESTVIKFCMQTGSLLWELYRYNEASDADVDLVKNILYDCYKRLHLPYNGRLPGFRHHSISGCLPCCVPPIEIDSTREDWSEVLWERSAMTVMILPIELHSDPCDFRYIGQEFMSSVTKLVQVLIDVGSIKKKGVANETLVATEENYRRFKRIFSKPERVYKLEYTSQPPEWYDSLAHGDPHNSYLEVI